MEGLSNSFCCGDMYTHEFFNAKFCNDCDWLIHLIERGFRSLSRIVYYIKLSTAKVEVAKINFDHCCALMAMCRDGFLACHGVTVFLRILPEKPLTFISKCWTIGKIAKEDSLPIFKFWQTRQGFEPWSPNKRSEQLIRNATVELMKYTGDIFIFQDISHNAITGLPEGIGNMRKLRKFNISHNKVSYIPVEIGTMTGEMKGILYLWKLSPEETKTFLNSTILLWYIIFLFFN